MRIRFIFIFGIFVAFSLVGPISGLKCYICSAELGTNDDCEVNLDNLEGQDCYLNFLCSVYITKEDNRSTIYRLCEPANECEVIRAQNSHILPTSNRTVESCRTCNIDLCNSSLFHHDGSTLSLILGCISFFLVTLVFNKIEL